jgi:F-type H+-transporting ATPase subunit delta
MNESKISVRYAKALFNLVKEENSLEKHKEDIELLYQCVREIPELKFVIQSPVIKASDKIRVFEESFREGVSPLTLSFLRLVLEHRREENMEGIARYFLTLVRAEQGIRSAELVTAKPVDDALRQSISQLIAKKFNTKVDLHEQVDPSIIGGFVLRVGDQQIDASISSKLKRIKRELIQSQN